jgi:hypothetical protein
VNKIVSKKNKHNHSITDGEIKDALPIPMPNQTITDKQLLEIYDWVIECESPFEIRHEDGSFATGQAASIVLDYLKELQN